MVVDQISAQSMGNRDVTDADKALRILAFALLLVNGCSAGVESTTVTPSIPLASSSPPPAAPSLSSAPPGGLDLFAPPPYTIEQLRSGIRQGQTYHFRVGDGGRVEIHAVVFTRVDSVGFETKTTITDEQLVPLKADVTSSATWQELHDQGRFPKDKTTVREDACGDILPVNHQPPSKRLCMVYEVALEGGGRAHFRFSKDFPGPPILKRVTDAEGHQVSLTTLLRLDPGP